MMNDEKESKSYVLANEPKIDSDESDIKEEIRRDVFTTREEAEDRAKEIGCVGTHSHDEDGILSLCLVKTTTIILMP